VPMAGSYPAPDIYLLSLSRNLELQLLPYLISMQIGVVRRDMFDGYPGPTRILAMTGKLPEANLDLCSAQTLHATSLTLTSPLLVAWKGRRGV
jgi:hypothetical protein